MILKTDHYHSMSLVISCSAVLQCRLDPAGRQQAFFGCSKKWGVRTPSSPLKLRLWLCRCYGFAAVRALGHMLYSFLST